MFLGCSDLDFMKPVDELAEGFILQNTKCGNAKPAYKVCNYRPVLVLGNNRD